MRAAPAAASISSSVASDFAKRRFSRTVAWKRYVSCGGCGDGVRILLDVHLLVEVLEDAVEERERRLHVEADTEQRADGKEEAGLERRECDERRNRDRMRAVRERQPAEPVHGGGH